MCPPSGVPWPHLLSVTSIEVTEVGNPGSRIVVISVTPTKLGDGRHLTGPYGLPSFEFHQELTPHKLGPFHVSVEQWI